MIELLPAGSWGDLATNQRLDQVAAEIRGDLRTEMANLRTELKTEMANLRTELKTEMGEFQTAIRTEMGGFRVELAQLRVEMHRSARQAMAVNTAAMLAIGGMLVAALRI